jgi:MFS family permease
MLQEVFGGTLIGVQSKFSELDALVKSTDAAQVDTAKKQLAAIATVAAGFTALLSLFNIGGRFFWASLSDKLGRKVTYIVFFVLGGVMYFSVPGSAAAGSIVLFVSAFCIILSMYGGGFATVPAYLADIFGTQMVGAIHGRLLTAWATAGVLGPVVVNYMREYQLGLGIPREQVYNQTMYILVGMLVVGLICNLLVRPLDAKWFMTDEELAVEKKLAHEKAAASELTRGADGGADSVSPIVVALAWAAVGIPLAWGVYRTLLSVAKFFA